MLGSPVHTSIVVGFKGSHCPQSWKMARDKWFEAENHLGLSINGAPNSWIIRENPKQKWMIWG
jgi:hypothetical protein